MWPFNTYWVRSLTKNKYSRENSMGGSPWMCCRATHRFKVQWNSILYNTKFYLAPLAFSEPNTWLLVLGFNQMDSPELETTFFLHKKKLVQIQLSSGDFSRGVWRHASETACRSGSTTRRRSGRRLRVLYVRTETRLLCEERRLSGPRIYRGKCSIRANFVEYSFQY